jgi:hypothetical protein
VSAAALRQPAAPRKNARAARGAAERRRVRTSSLRYRSFAYIIGSLGGFTLLVVFYLALMSNVTRLNYEYGKLAHERTRLLDESVRLDDQVARLESRERLAIVAARLGMIEPRRVDVAALPHTRPVTAEPANGIALLPAISAWLR